MNIVKGEIQNNTGSIIYPHTTTDIVFDENGKTLSQKLIELDAKIPVGGGSGTDYIHPDTHPASMITGLPTSLPADGGNSDTVDGKHADDFILKTEVKNTLTETTTGNVLDAVQGKVLNDKIDALVIPEEYIHPETHNVSMITGLPEVKNTLIEEVEGNVLDAVQGKILNDKITKINNDLDELHTDLGQRIGQRFRSINGEDIEIEDTIPNSYLQGLEIQGRTVKVLGTFTGLLEKEANIATEHTIIFNSDTIIGNKYTILVNVKTNTLTDVCHLNPNNQITHSKQTIPPGFTGTHSYILTADKESPTTILYPLGEGTIELSVAVIEGEWHDSELNVNKLVQDLNLTEATITVNGEKHTFYEPTIEGKTEVIDGKLVSLEPSIEGLLVLRSVPGISDTIDRATKIMVINVFSYVLTGEEAWTRSSNTFTFISENKHQGFSNIVCEEYDTSNNGAWLKDMSISGHNGTGGFNRRSVWIKDDNFSSTELWIAYLKQRFNSGNPITIYYQLETPIIKQLTTEEFNAYDHHKKVIWLNQIGDIKDSLVQDKNGSVVVKTNISKILHDFEWKKSVTGTQTTHLLFYTNPIQKCKSPTRLGVKSNILDSNFKIPSGSNDVDCIFTEINNNFIYVAINKTFLKSHDVIGLVEYLKENDFKMTYILETPITTHINHRATPTIPISQQINISFDEGVTPSSYYVDVLVNKLIYDNQHEQVILTLNKATNDLEKQIALLEYQQLIGGMIV